MELSCKYVCVRERVECERDGSVRERTVFMVLSDKALLLVWCLILFR